MDAAKVSAKGVNQPMKRTALAVCLLASVLLTVLPAIGQKQTKKPRILFTPPAFINGETFLNMSDADQTTYAMGLMDGFYASAFFGATDETVTNLSSCIQPMDSKQISAIFSKYVKDHPEQWHLPLSILAYNALNKACPGGLRVIANK